MLSIVIPTLNEEKYLPRLLASIKRQNFRDYEIIVADAGSRDKTIEIAKSYGCKIVKGGSPAKGRNEGAKVARGELLLFLDADIILGKDFLQKFLKRFQEKNLDIASTAFDVIEKNKIYKLGSKAWNLYFKANQYFFPCAIGSCLLVKKELHQKLGGFDEEIKVGEDFIYVRKAKKIAKFYFFYRLKCLVSARRFEREGIPKTFLKYVLIDLHMILRGPVKSDIFNYKFDHYSEKKI